MAEVVFALSLLLMVLVMVFSLFPTSSAASHQARQQLRANALAQAALEEARSMPFSRLAGAPGPTPVEEGEVRFVPTRELFAVPGEDARQLVGVRVTVRWNYRGRPRQLSQEAYVARLPR